MALEDRIAKLEAQVAAYLKVATAASPSFKKTATAMQAVIVPAQTGTLVARVAADEGLIAAQDAELANLAQRIAALEAPAPPPPPPLPPPVTFGPVLWNRIMIGGSPSFASGYDVQAARQKWFEGSIYWAGGAGGGTDHKTALESRGGLYFGYENGCFTNPGDSTWHTNTGVLYSAADPAWFLLDSAGAHIVSSYGVHLMDVGHPGYQKAWCDRVLAEFTARGFKAVHIDDVNFRHGFGTRPVKYPTDRTWQQAYRAFFAYLYPRFQAAGIKVLCNISYAREYPDCFKDFLQFMDVAMDESFARPGDTGYIVDDGTGANGTPGAGGFGSSAGWQHYLWKVEEAERQGKTTVAVVPCPDTTAIAKTGFLFGLATALLATQGRLVVQARGPNYDAEPPWFQDLADLVANAGTPATSWVADGGGYLRVFPHLRVRVNSKTTTQTVDGVSLPAGSAQLVAV